jgi:hypothetical protein
VSGRRGIKTSPIGPWAGRVYSSGFLDPVSEEVGVESLRNPPVAGVQSLPFRRRHAL